MEQPDGSAFERLKASYCRIVILVTSAEPLLAEFERSSTSKSSSLAKPPTQHHFRLRTLLTLLSSRLSEIRLALEEPTLENFLRAEELIQRPLSAKDRSSCMQMLLFAESSTNFGSLKPEECVMVLNEGFAVLDVNLQLRFLEMVHKDFPSVPSPSDVQKTLPTSRQALYEFSRPSLPVVPKVRRW